MFDGIMPDEQEKKSIERGRYGKNLVTSKHRDK